MLVTIDNIVIFIYTLRERAIIFKSHLIFVQRASKSIPLGVFIPTEQRGSLCMSEEELTPLLKRAKALRHMKY